jgi:hypothetical protein
VISTTSLLAVAAAVAASVAATVAASVEAVVAAGTGVAAEQAARTIDATRIIAITTNKLFFINFSPLDSLEAFSISYIYSLTVVQKSYALKRFNLRRNFFS